MQSNPQCSARDAACLRDVTTTAMDGTTLARLSQAHSEERERAPARKEERERAVIAQSFLESIKDDTSHVTRTRNVSLRASRSLLYHRRHGLLQQRSDRVRGLCPVLDPLLDGFRVEVRLLRQRVVVPKLLQGKAFALPARVDGDQPVEWTLLSSHSLESKLAPGEREREREREKEKRRKRGGVSRPPVQRSLGLARRFGLTFTLEVVSTLAPTSAVFSVPCLSSAPPTLALKAMPLTFAREVVVGVAMAAAALPPHMSACLPFLSLARADNRSLSPRVPCFSDTPAFSPSCSCSWSTFYPLGP